MAITVTNAEVKPALVYDHFFMESMSLQQTRIGSSTEAPKYSLKVVYRMFAEDTSGKRYYDTLVKDILMPDYFLEAMQKAGDGDMDLVNAMGAIEMAMAKIVEEKTNLGKTQVI